MALVSGVFALRPFRRPRLWLGLWLLAVAVVMVLSLANLSRLPPVPEGGDKVEHFLAYALLAASAMQLFARRTGCIVVALLLVAMGAGLEFAQGALTTTRMADPRDALANTLGVLAGLATLFTPLRGLLLAFDARLLSGRAS
ncbi:VanZ family protein [Pseudoxanthomonas sp. CF385]|uniref:VanZ family protein n=1 Tax=Pseudoxanthomonas sp. CF385 TaxID=1881042 RepID=UPI001587A7A3|nr:VanZ family protein [Pseudoxanthomonas sp. CF385]